MPKNRLINGGESHPALRDTFPNFRWGKGMTPRLLINTLAPKKILYEFQKS